MNKDINTIPKWDILKTKSVEEIVKALEITVCLWTERSLCSHAIMDDTVLKKYDEIFGDLLRWADKEYENLPNRIKNFIDIWAYKGKIYRVQGKYLVFRKDLSEPYLRRCGLKYHNKVASWSKSYEFNKFNKICDSQEYLFIEGNTFTSFGFDVVKFYENIDPNSNFLFRLKHEQEIIFPINERYILSKEYIKCQDYIRKKNYIDQ